MGSDANEWTYIRRDGTRVPVFLNVTVLRAADGEISGYLDIAIDLTQRKRDEQEERRLLDILELSPDFIGVADLEGRLKYHNRAARRMVGLPEDTDLSTMHIKKRYAPRVGRQTDHGAGTTPGGTGWRVAW